MRCQACTTKDSLCGRSCHVSQHLGRTVGFLSLTVTVGPSQGWSGLVAIMEGGCGAGDCRAVEGLGRTLLKQVYLHLLKPEEHLLALKCEVKNAL